MIPKGDINESNYFYMTKTEAKAFIIFELKEKYRHLDDINQIERDIEIIKEIHGIEEGY